jgi:hypothetical protein
VSSFPLSLCSDVSTACTGGLFSHSKPTVLPGSCTSVGKVGEWMLSEGPVHFFFISLLSSLKHNCELMPVLWLPRARSEN